MTENDLHSMIQSWENIQLLISYAIENPGQIDLILKMAMDDSDEENWRAAWIIDKIHEVHPESIVPFLPAITEFALKTNRHGKKRHFLKLVSLHPIAAENEALLLNHCLNIFTDGSETVSVRVHSMQVLYNLAVQEPELAGELIEIIENELEFHNSAGLASRARKLLPKLRKLRYM